MQDLAGHLRKRKKPGFPFSLQGGSGIRTDVADLSPDERERIISRAERVCEHVFDLLGSGPIKVMFQKSSLTEKEGTNAIMNSQPFAGYSPIEWQMDFKSRYCWSSSGFYLDIIKTIPYGKADIKVPWELSRFHHLTVLGQAYQLTGNEKYAREFVKQISDWIENNPPKFGVNWASTMDVAIRAANWILGFSFFKDSAEISDEFLLKFLKSLLVHARHIMGNLERSRTGLNSNHYLSNLTGLIYLGIMFPEFREAKRWRNFGVQELVKEMEKQVNSDGCDFESSIPYHRLVLELFGYSALLCKLGNIELSDYFWNELKKMFDFVAYYTKPDGLAPQIGDNDDGQLHKLQIEDRKSQINDHRYLFDLAKRIWREYRPPIPTSKDFPQSGYYIMRDKDDYLIISAGEVGTGGIGNHKHNDMLSFELQIGKQDFIIDPGTYVYTPNVKMRNLFRSTAYHNTVVIDGEEQNRFDENQLFSMQTGAEIKVDKWETNNNYDFLDVQHSGYEHLKEPITHRRQIFFHKTDGYWIIKDILTGKGKHDFDLYFHFAPMSIGVSSLPKELIKKVKSIRNPIIEGNFDVDESLVVKTKNMESTNLLVIPVNTAFDLSLEIENGWVSYSYGVKVKAPVLRYKKTAICPVEFITILYHV